MKEEKVNTQYGGDCLAEGTMIEMVDGTCKRIEDIMIGDRIAAFNTNGDRCMPQVENIFRGFDKTALVVNEDDGRLIYLTANHHIKTPSGIKSADELNCTKKEYLRIRLYNDRPPEAKIPVYSLELEEHGQTGYWIVANGFLVSDWTMLCYMTDKCN